MKGEDLKVDGVLGAWKKYEYRINWHSSNEDNDQKNETGQKIGEVGGCCSEVTCTNSVLSV